MRYCVLLVLVILSCKQNSEQPKHTFKTHFETSNGIETATYAQTISYYKDLAKHYPEITLQTIGETDSGEPLHLATFNPHTTGEDFSKLRHDNRIILIVNGIHPGESDGIDATMMLFRDLANGKVALPKQTVIAAIPIYNVGGSLNRNSSSRTNQNGPLHYGFRGNARNYDLNRDFIKSDTKNARAFAQLFHKVQPDVFIDTHVSNGADYQYTLTHLFTQHNKLGGGLGSFLHNTYMPELEKNLEKQDWDIIPYVNVFNRTPESGFTQFKDSPRYSTGYATLFNALGMMVETHMLKPYKQRVEGTYELLKQMVALTEIHGDTISKLRRQQKDLWQVGDYYPLHWVVDTTKQSTLNFKGYEASRQPSAVTGQTRLKYDNTKPFTKPVTYQNYFKPSDSVVIPKAYIIPKGMHHVLELLKLNNIAFNRLKNDTTISVESYKIKRFETRNRPYEGHYQHYDTTVESRTEQVNFTAGDVLVHTNQIGIRYLLETLEPQAPDSFFNWNFFDTILRQKEGFSPYVWEDKAQQLLETDPELKAQFELKKKTDQDFANNWYAQLDWLHKQSEHYEKAHLQYPVYRIP